MDDCILCNQGAKVKSKQQVLITEVCKKQESQQEERESRQEITASSKNDKQESTSKLSQVSKQEGCRIQARNHRKKERIDKKESISKKQERERKQVEKSDEQQEQGRCSRKQEKKERITSKKAAAIEERMIVAGNELCYVRSECASLILQVVSEPWGSYSVCGRAKLQRIPSTYQLISIPADEESFYYQLMLCTQLVFFTSESTTQRFSNT
ncbi:hypothetical protein Tco_1086894 [Tanacetum coccineum]